MRQQSRSPNNLAKPFPTRICHTSRQVIGSRYYAVALGKRFQERKVERVSALAHNFGKAVSILWTGH